MNLKKITTLILAAVLLCQQLTWHWPTEVLAAKEFSPDPISEQVTGDDANAYLEAETAFAALAADHDVYALLYQCGSYDVMESPSYDSVPIVNILTGHQVRLIRAAFADDGIWYQAEVMVNGILYRGYIEDDYLVSADEGLNEWRKTWGNAASENPMPFSGAARAGTDLNAFPASYRPYIQSLLAAHPNWTFVPFHTNLDWNTVLQQEMSPARNLVPSNCMESWKMSNVVLSAPYWVQASEAIVRYYLDPRNFLNEDAVFQFELLSFNSACHTESGVKAILKGTFMANATLENGLSYAQNFMNIGWELNVSPYHLASRVRQEQGVEGTSPLISGTYPGYEGYYNYYNIQASGATYDEIIRNGLEEAKAGGWTTRYAALYGGSQKVCNNYIKIGQNTLYLQKFDVDNSDGNLYWHQYMQNLLAAESEGKSARTGYANMNVINNSFIFRIPIYNNMPAAACMMPKDSLASPVLRSSISNYDKIMLKWQEIPGAQGYQIYRSTKPNTGFKQVATVNSGGTVSWSDKVGINKTYYYKIRSFRYFNDIGIFSPYSAVVKASTKITAPQISSLSVSSYRKITIKWDKTKNVTGYKVYRKTGTSGSYKLIKNINGAGTTSYADSSISPNVSYYYRVKAYKTVKKKDYNSSYSNVVLAKTNLGKPSIRSVSSSSPTKVKLSWKKADGAQGYQIYRASSYKGKYTKVKTVTGGNVSSCTNTGLVPNKTYYYKVRAYRTVNKVKTYSKFSSVTSITPRLEAPEIKSVTGISTDRVKISWKKTDGAKGYRLYRSTSKKGPYKLVGTTTGSSYTDIGLSSKKTYYYKVRAYVKVSGSNRYSGYSDLWSVQTKN